ncbi:LPS translocon maturation chaperone LptM [Burkholderia guangdongensis]|uniref:LPS translocon maturation chaperone LptM n=1 Tax=Burkholderia guangdongensis TaxID=1792500 RepID=UPI0015CC56CD|nr:lipoprotein [Burkholderia guangdongensis]
MRVVFRMSAIVAALAILAGCGQRGPLYMPSVPPLPPKPAVQTAPPSSDVTPADDSAADSTPDTTGTPLMLTPDLPASGAAPASDPAQ